LPATAPLAAAIFRPGRHRLGGALCVVRIRPRRQFEQPLRRYLPREAPTVLAPAASARGAAVADDRVPVLVRLCLTIGDDHEADGFIRLKVRATVEANEPPSEYRELYG